ncbi:MAG: beta-N-acetylhexosaminidase [Paracholeplasma sp.]|nr:beta-N-acetylhexosaminidase [Paracholeplasma sp.]MDY3196467.1 beta-N-acetylhexosaminidase [Paracholeplasma sp.]
MKYNLDKLTVEEKIGQLFMFGVQSDVVDERTIKLIRDYKVGNVILFARNCINPNQLFKLNQDLQKEALKHLGIPMFISIDQEGGMVTRIFEGSTFFPGAMTIGATSNVNRAYLNGVYMGQELEALGINMNLAPVLDVNNNPKNPVIGVRSYSDNAEVVADFGTAYVKGLQETILATAKHFPGHGDTNVDSHLALPKVDYPIERLESIELVPFKRAIKEGIHAIMSSHIDFPAFTENGLPTTLSEKCLTTFLREDLGFEGLIVTDGMEMKAVQDHYGTVEACLMAVQAGANQVCICHTEALQFKAFERFKEAVATGELPMAVLDERVSRVLKYKELLNDKYYDVAYEMIKPIVENETHQAFALETVRKAATLVKGKAYQQNGTTLFIGVLPKATSGADDTDGTYNMNKQIKHELPSIETMHLPINPTDEDISRLVKKANLYDQVVISSYNSNIYTNQIKAIEALSQLDNELYVVSMRNPYDLHYTDKIDNYVCLYEYTPNSIKVLIEYLRGALSFDGRLPIREK